MLPTVSATNSMQYVQRTSHDCIFRVGWGWGCRQLLSSCRLQSSSPPSRQAPMQNAEFPHADKPIPSPLTLQKLRRAASLREQARSIR